MILLTINEIIELHGELIKKTGGLLGIRDIGLLESALYSPMQSFGDQEVYKNIDEKAARLAFSLIKNHSFIDGEERVEICHLLQNNINKFNYDILPS